MYRRLYHSPYGRRFFHGLFTTVFVGSLGAISYPRYTIHADDQATDNDIPDYEAYRDIVRLASSRHQPIQPSPPRPPLTHGINLFENPDTGIVRFDTALDFRYPLWSASEVRSAQIGDGPIWTCFAIYQGIYGLESSTFVHSYLLDDILDDVAKVTFRYYPTDNNHAEIGSTFPPEEASEPFSDVVDNIIRSKFTQMNDFIVNKGLGDILSSPSRSAAVVPLTRAVSGCTCLLAMYESHSASLKIVATGSSRAALGRRAQTKLKEPIYHAQELPLPNLGTANDHRSSTYHNAFGLAMQRWTQDVQERLHQEYLGDPPVIGDQKIVSATAIEPRFQTVEIKPGDFLVMGTDALWDVFTTKEVVDLVGIWLRHDHRGMQGEHQDLPKLPVDGSPTIGKKYQCADINAATHIIKNALSNGGYFLTTAVQNGLQTGDEKQRNGVGAYVIFFDDTDSPVHEYIDVMPSGVVASQSD